MDPIAQDLLKAVRPELGYKEKDGQHTKFGAWYAANVDKDPQYKNAPWCDMFIAWAADKAGVRDYVGTFAWTPSHARWFERQGAWSERPEPGALVFFDWSGSKNIKKIDHVGIVERVTGDRIHTIEANVDRVWLKRKVRDESKVVGYGLPRKVKENLGGRVEPGDPGRDAVSVGTGRKDAGLEFFPAPVETVPVMALIAVVAGSALLVMRTRLRRSASSGTGRHRKAARQEKAPAQPTPPARRRDDGPRAGARLSPRTRATTTSTGARATTATTTRTRATPARAGTTTTSRTPAEKVTAGRARRRG